ncbi:hypothetical protein PhCBS80983_g03360 [Powellomyces hirtus]|uniref:Deoxyhypusine hydroxylase n=1 Tax=Powellomyces hirtus TaxID=109895 RepID=A0A507E2P8_9FUNG|nr:hypothetical protein PhCBS80983_g03360 [Powellomyces hirtus]
MAVTSTSPVVADAKTYASLDSQLNDPTVPLDRRFRALFTLKSLNSSESVGIISKGFADDSALLKHELAYVLGQMRNPEALPTLVKVLETLDEDPMVRHEAAEAMGAIGLEQSLPILIQYRDTDASRAVRETCVLAIEKIEYEVSLRNGTATAEASSGPYTSVDPAPPVEQKEEKTTAELRAMLLDTELSLFKRYRAMFALRNRGDVESVLALAEGLHDESALFRHEIGYIFGQMQHPASVPALIKCLSNTSEEGMVRHECAEALGSIAEPECLEALKQFVNDPERVVRESCIVGLDMYEYETSGAFQYADGLTKAATEQQ